MLLKVLFIQKPLWNAVVEFKMGGRKWLYLVTFVNHFILVVYIICCFSCPLDLTANL